MAGRKAKRQKTHHGPPRTFQEVTASLKENFDNIRCDNIGHASAFNDDIPFVHPGLVVDGIQIPLPLPAEYGDRLISLSVSKPVKDSTDLFRIGSQHIRFANPSWFTALRAMSTKAIHGLMSGIPIAGMDLVLQGLFIQKAPPDNPTIPPIKDDRGWKLYTDEEWEHSGPAVMVFLPSNHQGGDIFVPDGVGWSSCTRAHSTLRGSTHSTAPSSAFGISSLALEVSSPYCVGALDGGYRLGIMYRVENISDHWWSIFSNDRAQLYRSAQHSLQRWKLCVPEEPLLVYALDNEDAVDGDERNSPPLMERLCPRNQHLVRTVKLFSTPRSGFSAFLGRITVGKRGYATACVAPRLDCLLSLDGRRVAGRIPLQTVQAVGPTASTAERHLKQLLKHNMGRLPVRDDPNDSDSIPDTFGDEDYKVCHYPVLVIIQRSFLAPILDMGWDDPKSFDLAGAAMALIEGFDDVSGVSQELARAASLDALGKLIASEDRVKKLLDPDCSDAAIPVFSFLLKRPRKSHFENLFKFLVIERRVKYSADRPLPELLIQTVVQHLETLALELMKAHKTLDTGAWDFWLHSNILTAVPSMRACHELLTRMEPYFTQDSVLQSFRDWWPTALQRQLEIQASFDYDDSSISSLLVKQAERKPNELAFSILPPLLLKADIGHIYGILCSLIDEGVAGEPGRRYLLTRLVHEFPHLPVLNPPKIHNGDTISWTDIVATLAEAEFSFSDCDVEFDETSGQLTALWLRRMRESLLPTAQNAQPLTVGAAAVSLAADLLGDRAFACEHDRICNAWAKICEQPLVDLVEILLRIGLKAAAPFPIKPTSGDLIMTPLGCAESDQGCKDCRRLNKWLASSSPRKTFEDLSQDRLEHLCERLNNFAIALSWDEDEYCGILVEKPAVHTYRNQFERWCREHMTLLAPLVSVPQWEKDCGDRRWLRRHLGQERYAELVRWTGVFGPRGWDRIGVHASSIEFQWVDRTFWSMKEKAEGEDLDVMRLTELEGDWGD